MGPLCDDPLYGHHVYDHNGQASTVIRVLAFNHESSVQIPNLVSSVTGETLMEKKEGREERNIEIIGSVVEKRETWETPPPSTTKSISTL